MIVKKGRARQVGSGSFGDTARYAVDRLADDPDAFYMYGNINSAETLDDLEVAIAEVEATMAENTTAGDDRIYHLIASFPAGERPTNEQLRDITEHLVKQMGYEGHHYIAGLHTDTDNFHLDIAICKVHPDTHRNVSIHKDFDKLDFAAREMEIKHSLMRDKGIFGISEDGEILRLGKATSKEREPSSAAKDFEAHTGIESFQTWARKDARAALNDAMKRDGATWQDLHDTAAKFNMQIKQRGNGYVISDMDSAEKHHAKLSDIGVDNVAKHLGKFKADEQAKSDREASLKRYTEMPAMSANAARRNAQNELLAEWREKKSDYIGNRQKAKEANAELKVSIKDRRTWINEHSKQERQQIRQEYKQAIDKAKTPDQVAEAKAHMQSALSIAAAEKATSLMALNAQAKMEREAIREEFNASNPGTYRSFLMAEAEKGNEVALAAVRGFRRAEPEPDRTNKAFVQSPHDNYRDTILKQNDYQHKAHRNGDVSYTRDGQDVLTDYGKTIKIHQPTDRESVEMALRMAQAKYGREVALHSNNNEEGQAFRRLAVEVAVEKGINIVFADHASETYRRQLVETKKQEYEQQQQARQQQPEPKAVIEKTAFAVPFKEKAEAEQIGLVWDKNLKALAAEKGSDAETDALARWPVKVPADMDKAKATTEQDIGKTEPRAVPTAKADDRELPREQRQEPVKDDKKPQPQQEQQPADKTPEQPAERKTEQPKPQQQEVDISAQEKLAAERNKVKAADVHQHIAVRPADLSKLAEEKTVTFRAVRDTEKNRNYNTLLVDVADKQGKKQTLVIPMDRELKKEVEKLKLKEGDKISIEQDKQAAERERLRIEVIERNRSRGISK